MSATTGVVRAFKRSAELLTPALRRVADGLEHTGWAAMLVDARWRLVWMSRELRGMTGGNDDEGIGLHFVEADRLLWSSRLDPDSRRTLALTNLPYIAHDTPGGIEYLKRFADPEAREVLETITPQPAPPVWVATFRFRAKDATPPLTVRGVAVRHELDGELIGTSFVYGPALPPALTALMTRGDRGLFERMARLVEPAPRSVAVLFADLQSSTSLSRRLPSGVFFRLVREITSAVDQVVIERRGIIGKHVGDGVTSFFLADDLGGDSGAARAAVDAAREICSRAREVAHRLADEGYGVRPEDVVVNVGLHWGGAVYIGQVATEGRLEVSALGDEVNECARIADSAHDGELLASKGLVERLAPDDSEALDIAPHALRYRLVSELEHAGDRARREAGAIAVANLARTAQS